MNFLGGRGAEKPTVYVKDIKVSAPFENLLYPSANEFQ